jgi:hypothetical protein
MTTTGEDKIFWCPIVTTTGEDKIIYVLIPADDLTYMKNKIKSLEDEMNHVKDIFDSHIHHWNLGSVSSMTQNNPTSTSNLTLYQKE